jgi:hypothetical protein
MEKIVGEKKRERKKENPTLALSLRQKKKLSSSSSSKVPRRSDRPCTQVAQVGRPDDLHAVDVQDPLLRRHEPEVDQVRQGPQRVVGRHHRQQLGLDRRNDEIGPAFEEVDEGEEDAGEGRGPEQLVEGGLGDDGLCRGRVFGEDVAVERGVPQVAWKS